MPRRPASRPSYLSATAIALLKFMTGDLTKDYTIRKLSQGINQGYRITYETVNRLAEDGILTLERKANLHICRLNLRGNVQTFAFVESLRAEEFLKSRPAMRVLVANLVARIRNVLPFFCLVIFGSTVKGKWAPRSDVDILLVLPDQNFQNQVENELASIARTSAVGLHEMVLLTDQFMSMLSGRERAKRPNLASEVLANHITPYGAEAFYALVSRIAP